MTKPKADDEKKNPKKPQLNIRPFPAELLKRIGLVSGALGKTQGQWVISVLEARTRDYEAMVRDVTKREEINRSRYDEKNEGEQEPIRRGAEADVRETTTKNIRDKS